eukprot:9549965-Alexandrium_andersonii.AAC.1
MPRGVVVAKGQMPVVQVGREVRWCTARSMQQASQGLRARGTASKQCRAETADACSAVGALTACSRD